MEVNLHFVIYEDVPGGSHGEEIAQDAGAAPVEVETRARITIVRSSNPADSEFTFGELD